MGRMIWILALVVGCDAASGPSVDVADTSASDAMGDDAARPDGGAPNPDGGAMDAATPDGGAMDTGTADAGPADAGPPDALPCELNALPSARLAPALRVEGCDLVSGAGATVAVPRGVVISADSLRRDARTPLHEPPHYRELAAAHVDLAWLLVTWDGAQPREGGFNGAYLARMCEHARWASDAGLQVVLALHSERWGPAFEGHGAPAWATGDARSPAAAWTRFWTSPALRDALAQTWIRLVDTCGPETPITGVQWLTGAPDHPERAGWEAELRAYAEAAWGPVLVFSEADGPGPDRVRTLSSPRPLVLAALPPAGPRFVAGVFPDASLSALEGAGVGWAAWQDGFGVDPWALRDEDGAPGPLFDALTRTWPVAVAGRLEGFGATDAGWWMEWEADGRAAGLTRVHLAGRGPVEASLTPDGPFDWFTGYDPVTDTLQIFVEGAPGAVRLELTAIDDE
jgi:hypothetical protein